MTFNVIVDWAEPAVLVAAHVRVWPSCSATLADARSNVSDLAVSMQSTSDDEATSITTTGVEGVEAKVRVHVTSVSSSAPLISQVKVYGPPSRSVASWFDASNVDPAPATSVIEASLGGAACQK